MIRFNRFNQQAALCALLLCFSLGSAADDIQEANKLFKGGQAAQALSKVDAILANQPKDAQARFLKGLILAEQGQTEESVRIFTALTVDFPELPEPYNNLAVIYAEQGQYEKAKTALETALHTHPSYSTAHENLGDIYAQMASQAYGRALQLDRSNASSKTKLALIKEMHTPTVKSTPAKIQIASLPTPQATARQNPHNPPATPTVTASPAAPTATAITPAPAPAIIAVKASAEPAPAKPAVAATDNTNSSDEILKAVHNWAQAWSARNAGKYLSMYAKDFKTPNNESRSIWEKQRRERIDKPHPIVVTIINARIKLMDETHASVSFVQSYRSGTLKSTTRKTLQMIRENNAWKIQSEQTGV